MNGGPTPRVPRRPSQLPSLADDCLHALVRHGLGSTISIGGAVGLLQYHDYRVTHDLDAWWQPGTTAADRQRVVAVVRSALETHGPVKVRAWGDVVSIGLELGEGRAFSFQIATRSVQLMPSETVAWTEVPVDSLIDLVASKMVALVERGAPRDLRDIHALCTAGLVEPEECWALWRQRQERAGSDADAERARLALETHLERLALHRPLEAIADPAARREAECLRCWFREDFLRALA